MYTIVISTSNDNVMKPHHVIDCDGELWSVKNDMITYLININNGARVQWVDDVMDNAGATYDYHVRIFHDDYGLRLNRHYKVLND